MGLTWFSHKLELVFVDQNDGTITKLEDRVYNLADLATFSTKPGEGKLDQYISAKLI